MLFWKKHIEVKDQNFLHCTWSVRFLQYSKYLSALRLENLHT